MMLLAPLLIAAASAVAPLPGPAPAAKVQRFALVVGHNEPPHAGLPRLRYGDDDAVRWAILLGTFGARVELLSALDAESKRLYGDRAPPMRPPGREELRAAMGRLRAAVAAAHLAGAHTVFYFVYAGHGDVEDGEGYVTLADGRLYRRDLEEMILGASGADTNHVVVDACRSYYLVYDRGPGGTRRPWGRPYFVSGAAARFRNTGFLLASSSEAPTHEWEEFQAGIFSHELRSGLIGSADVNGDGRISYEEIAAFVRVANRPVRNARFRPDFLARAPENGDGVFMDLADASGGALDTGKRGSARYLLEDQLGVRWADLHPSANHPVTLRLPSAAWSPSHFFFRPAGGDQEYRIPAGRTVSLSERAAVPVAAVTRGAAHEAFSQLFAEAFDESALLPPRPGAEADLSARAAAALRWGSAGARPLRSVALAGMTVGGITLGATVALSVTSALRRGRALEPTTPGDERAAINRNVETMTMWRNVTAVAGGALVAGGAALFFYDRSAERQPLSSVLLAPLPGGGAMAAIQTPWSW